MSATKTSQREFINGLLMECFDGLHPLRTTEGELFDALVQCSTLGCLELKSNLARACLMSGAVRRVADLHIVANPKAVVAYAFEDMLRIIRIARADRTAEEIELIEHADEYGAGEFLVATAADKKETAA